MPYQCRVVSGNGSATRFLTPMVQAWADTHATRLEPGTFNLCAGRFVMITPEMSHETLAPFAALAPAFQQAKPGFDPRLYPVVLNETVPAWLFRWSEPDALTNFVGSQPGVCERPERFLEIVAAARLRAVPRAADRSIIRLVFGA